MVTFPARLTALATALGIGLAALPAMAQTYALEAGDKVRIHIEDWPGLSGEYVVNPDKKLVMPVVGDISIRNLNTQQLAAEVSLSLMQRKKLSARPTTFAEVSAYKPFFILGDVQKAGDYPFRPDLTIQQAISIAGGVYRPMDFSATRFERDAILARGDLRALTEGAKRFRIHEARLKAERDGTEIEPLAKLLPGDADQEQARYYADDMAELTARKAEFATQADMVRGLKVLYQKEIDSLRLQITAENRQLTAIRGEGASVDKLTEKGLTSNQRRLTVERAIAQTVSQIQSLETTIVRTEQSILLADEKLATLTARRHEAIELELQKLWTDSAAAQAKIETARLLVAEAEQFTALGTSSQSDRKNLNVKASITRRRAGSTATNAPVALTDVIEPGDVIVIERVAQAAALR